MAVGSETMTMALEMDSTMFQGLSRMVARVTTTKYTACIWMGHRQKPGHSGMTGGGMLQQHDRQRGMAGCFGTTAASVLLLRLLPRSLG